MTTRNDYAEDRADADELIDEFGQDGKLRRETKTGSSYSPTITTTDYDCTFVVLDYRNREIDGTRILSTDKKALLKAGSLAITPTTADKLVIGGVAHAIMNVAPLSPGGTVVLYEIQARR